ncbi:MAG TPA: NAD-dependent epimerase/dehydratase family protein [Pirellulales bacterium]|nr:NAD-dependent epimerase/dehydratase family protein [Pirellulales bacterium]
MSAFTIENEDQLDDLLSEPTPEVVAALGRLSGDILVLGVAGKMGPSLARMARRASDAAGIQRRVIGVARFSAGGQEALEAYGVETIQCDLHDEGAVVRLPEAENVIYMVGRKFGSTGEEYQTWATNCYVPALICRKYRHSRIAAFSTGNVYGLAQADGGGSCESDSLAPVGEYAMSALGRERLFEYFSRSQGTPLAIVRLNYACELRYGVLVDLAQRIQAGEPVDLSMGYLNTIWQGDANAMTLCALEHVASPPWTVNVTGPELLSVRSICERLGELLDKLVRYTGIESDTAILSNVSRATELWGTPRIGVDQLLTWIVDWVGRGGRSLGKPTHFESRDGKF